MAKYIVTITESYFDHCNLQVNSLGNTMFRMKEPTQNMFFLDKAMNKIVTAALMFYKIS